MVAIAEIYLPSYQGSMASNHSCRNSKQSNVKELWWRTLVLVKLW